MDTSKSELLPSISKELQVHPAGWQLSPDIVRLPILLMGYFMRKIYVHVSEVFKLSGDADTEIDSCRWCEEVL